MQTVRFTAEAVSSEINEDYEYEMIALADAPNDPQNYLIIQRSFEFDEQDRKYGIDRPHIEVCGNQEHTRIRSAELTSEKLRLTTSLKGAENIEIDLRRVELTDEFKERFRRIVGSGI